MKEWDKYSWQSPRNTVGRGKWVNFYAVDWSKKYTWYGTCKELGHRHLTKYSTNYKVSAKTSTPAAHNFIVWYLHVCVVLGSERLCVWVYEGDHPAGIARQVMKNCVNLCNSAKLCLWVCVFSLRGIQTRPALPLWSAIGRGVKQTHIAHFLLFLDTNTNLDLNTNVINQNEKYKKNKIQIWSIDFEK